MRRPSKAVFTGIFLITAAAGSLWQYHSLQRSLTNVTIREHDFSMEENLPPLDLNTATLQELTAIPGITKAAAHAILAYREEYGRFANTAALLYVEGIPQSMAVYLMEHTYVVPEETETAAPRIFTDPTAPSPTEPETEPVTEILFPIHLNEAGEEALCALPGIGKSLAAAIIAYRDSIGGFTSIEQLKDVPGIGESKLSAIRHLLYLPPPPETEPPKTEAPPDTTVPEIPVIELNTTTKEELMLLPGCTSELADSILHLRDLIHVFSNPLEVLYADGVTDEMLIQWMPYLTADPPATE